jgi:hypothetical protein
MSAPGQVVPVEFLLDRMIELVDPATEWFRGLWHVGSIVALNEVVEATEGRWSGALTSDAALTDFKECAVETIRRDHGVGTAEVRALVASTLQRIGGKPTPDSRTALSELQHLIVRAGRKRAEGVAVRPRPLWGRFCGRVRRR